MDSKTSSQAEGGQTLVILALGMIVLLLFVGLAVDGGTVYMERRHSQNAADAAALAGTRLLAGAICGKPGTDDAAIWAEVVRIVGSNKVQNPASSVRADYNNKDETVLGPVGGGGIPTGATGVSATVEISRSTYFMTLIGIAESSASAPAVAMTGPIDRFSGGMLPIAVPLSVVETLEPDEEFYVLETNQHKGGGFCRQADDVCIGDPTSANAQRGWLNLNYIYNTAFLAKSNRYYRTFEENIPNRGCGSDPTISTDDGVQGWASGLCPYPFPVFPGAINGTTGDFVHGSSGARQSSLKQIERFVGDIVYVPIFDYIYMSDYMAANFPKPEGIGWPRAGGGGNAFLYHIVGFAAVRVEEIDGHKLVGAFQNAITGEGHFSPSTGFGTGACNSMQLYGVSLWR
jgi:hypothetical protein